MENKNYLVVVAYDCGIGERGKIISRHSTIELAEKASKRTGYDSFLSVKRADENENRD